MVSGSWDGSEPFRALLPCLGAFGILSLPLLFYPTLLTFYLPPPSPQVVGCDHKLDSIKQEDKCLQCGGDGSSCYPVTGTFDGNDLSRGGVVRGSPQGSVARPSWLACHLL